MRMTNEELWKITLGELEVSLSKANFETWFSHTRLVSKENGKATIGVKSIFTKEWLENKYNHSILQSIQKHDSSIREISCIIHTVSEKSPDSNSRRTNVLMERESRNDVLNGNFKDEKKNVFEGKSETAFSTQGSENVKKDQFVFYDTEKSSGKFISQTHAVNSQQGMRKKNYSNLNSRYTFENFIVGENNELARAACFSVSQNPGTLYNPLFIYGVVGVGKTHLMQAIGNEVLKNFPEKIVRYTTSERFTNELIEGLKNQTMNAFKESYQEIDVLLIDDVQFLSGREKTQQEFFHIFNNLYLLNKQIVITSDRTPKAIPTLEDRLKSRFEGGMIVDISRPDLETRMAILRLKLFEKGGVLEDDCVRFIAENITNNIRELEGALNRVIASAEFQKVRPTVPYIGKILGQIITTNKRTVTLESITKSAAEFYNVPEEELLKKGRKKEVAFARQVAMHLARAELSISLSGIGKHFGGRDHTTVLHAIEHIQKDMEKDGRFKEEIISLRERLYQ